MELNYLESVKKQFEYYKMPGEMTYCQLYSKHFKIYDDEKIREK